MAWGWSTTRYSPIAVDFGADSLKLLQIIPSDPPQMVAAASMDLPEHARTNHAARHAFFSDSLKELLSSRSFKGRRAICSIPSYQTLVQHLQIQGSSDPDEFEAQIHQHLRQRLNVDPSRMIIRHFRVGQVIRDGVTKQEVICMAASRDATLSHIQTAQRAKLEVVGMHCEPLAVLEAFSHLYRRDVDSKRVTCFVDLGAATTKVMITHGILMAFAKTIHVAGDHFTRQVAETYDMSFSEARQLRIQEVNAAEGQFPGADASDEDQRAKVDVPVHTTEMKNLESMASTEAAPAPSPLKALRVTSPPARSIWVNRWSACSTRCRCACVTTRVRSRNTRSKNWCSLAGSLAMSISARKSQRHYGSGRNWATRWRG